MGSFIILSRVSPDAFKEPKDFKKLAEAVSMKIKLECPEVTWKASYSTMGRFDTVDIVESENQQQVEKAAMIIRSLGHTVTETLPATPWKKFLAEL